MDENKTFKFEKRSNISGTGKTKSEPSSPKRIVLAFSLLTIFAIIPASIYIGYLIAQNKTQPSVVYVEGDASYKANPANGESDALAELCTAVSSSVVEVVATSKTVIKSGVQELNTQKCNGIVWCNAQDGFYILTNYHLVKDAKELVAISPSGSSESAKLVAYDETSDIALLSANLTDVRSVQIGKSAGLALGQSVVAVSKSSVSSGIISSLTEPTDIDGRKMHLFKSSIRMDQSTSGCGLFDMHGSLVGMMSFGDNTGAVGSEIVYTMPVDEMRYVAESLIQYGYVKERVFLGELDLQTLAGGEIVVTQINSESSPFMLGDILLKMDNKKIVNIANWTNYLMSCEVGDVIEVQIERTGETMTIEYQLVSVEDKNK